MTVLTAGQLTQLRSHPHASKFYLACHVPRIMCYCRVNDAGAARGDRVITYDNASWQANPDGGNYVPLDVPTGSTLYVGSAQGLGDYGRVRIKTMGATTITVARNEHIDWADDLYLTVANVVEPWAIYPRMELAADGESIDFWEDYTYAYTSEQQYYNPIPIMGPPAVGFLSGGACTIYFDGSASYGLNGASVLFYSWEFPGAAPNTSLVATPGNVTWNTAGAYMVRLMITDDNARSAVAYRWVQIYDSPTTGVHPYTEFDVDGLQGDIESGSWRATFTVRGTNLGPTYFRDNAQVALFADGTAGGSSMPIPGNHPNRSNLLFVGWIVGETIVKNPLTNEVSFEAAGICERMKALDSFPRTLTAAAVPTSWFEAQNLSLDLSLATLLRWRSTILEITDVHLLLDSAKAILTADFAHGSLYDQCQLMMDRVKGKIASDKQSCIYCRVDPNVLPTGAERNALDTIFSLADTDWHGEIEWDKRVLDEVSRIDLAGFYYDELGYDPDVNDHPLLSLAPGETPLYEGTMERVDGLILEGQAQANQLSGDILAWVNNEYPRIGLHMAGMWTPIDIIPFEWVDWTFAASYTKREIAWTNARLIPRSVTINVDMEKGTAFVDVDLEKETDGDDGITPDYPPTEPPDDVPDPPEPPPVPPGPGGPIGGWRKHAYVSTDGGIWYTSSLVVSATDPTGDPSWVQKNGGLGADTNIRQMAFDVVEPERVQYCLSAETGNNTIYKRDTGVSDNWSAILTPAQALAYAQGAGYSGTGATPVIYSINSNPAQAGYLYCTFAAGWIGYSSPPDRPYWFGISMDYGSTWSFYGVCSNNQSNAMGAGLIESHFDGTVIWITCACSTTGRRTYRSADTGHTWVQVKGSDAATGTDVYACPVSNLRAYTNQTSGGVHYIYRTVDASAWAKLTGVGWDPKTYSNTALGRHWFNAQLLQAGLIRCCDGAYIYKSLDYGDTWTRATCDGAHPATLVELIPDAVDYLYLARRDGAPVGGHFIWLSADEGVTCYDKNGADPDTPGADSIPRTQHLTDFQPVWTLE